jgi:hypothetical protein
VTRRPDSTRPTAARDDQDAVTAAKSTRRGSSQGASTEAAPAAPAQANIRTAIAALVADQNHLAAAIADDLALAAHPWPDAPITPDAASAITRQLSPWLNCPHPDIREVSADRLHRLAEVFDDYHLGRAESEALVAAGQRLAASSLQRIWMERTDLPVALFDPLGVAVATNRPLRARAGSPSLEKPAAPINVAVASSLNMAALRHGSRDLGVNLGGESVGIGLDAIAAISGVPSALEPVDAWIHALEHRSQAVLTTRVFSVGRSSTLQELANAWGVSRERIRQLEVKVREAFEEHWATLLMALRSILSPAQKLILRQGHLVETFQGIFVPSLSFGSTISAAVAEAAGPWVHAQGWSHHADIHDELSSAQAGLRSGTDEYGLLGAERLFPLPERFLSIGEQLAFYGETTGLRRLCGQWSLRDSQRSRVAAALISIGRPATKAEIGSVAGIEDAGTVGSNLSVLAGIVALPI